MFVELLGFIYGMVRIRSLSHMKLLLIVRKNLAQVSCRIFTLQFQMTLVV